METKEQKEGRKMPDTINKKRRRSGAGGFFEDEKEEMLIYLLIPDSVVKLERP